MITAPTDHTVAVFSTHEEAEAAVRTLNEAGIDMRNLSIVGQNYATDEHPVGFINSGDRMLAWGKIGAFWGSVWGLLFGSAMLFVPGVGYIVFAGWLVSMLEGALIGGGIGALGGALSSIGIPKDTVVAYETALKAGDYLLIIHGDAEQAAKAEVLLGGSGATQVNSYTTTPAA